MRLILAAAAILGFAAVAAGAFGAHALDGRLDPKAAGWYDTAVQYQMLHALALLALAALRELIPNRLVTVAASCFVLGVFFFSGSLYAMAFGAPRWFGAITPVGGLAFLAGWAALLRLACKHHPKSQTED
jgi:uncharacterized membrane protein YgdD (TMEM256/DUF423 family)